MAYSLNQQRVASGYPIPTPPRALGSIFTRRETPDAMAGSHFDAGFLASRLTNGLASFNKADEASFQEVDEASMALPGTPRGTFRDSGHSLTADKASADFLGPELSHAKVPFPFLAPPLKPHPAARPPRKKQDASLGVANTKQLGQVTSLGTVGHPVHCAEACEYVMRKVACPDGASCLKCHACIPKVEEETLCDSVWTVVQPYSCNEPCEHANWKAECRRGTLCPKCNKCQWQPTPRKLATSKAEEGQLVDSSECKDPPTLPSPCSFTAYGPEAPQCVVSRQPLVMVTPMLHPPPGLELEANPPSLGSIGHPRTCGAACKFAHKPKGCKDGALCSHCHLCHWTRKGIRNDHI
eukprot:TRINITY_DN7885_c0_g1_i1.p1 TRINITY_DN7885_c0_g1~~TRINITY_DN7885_c0_g1_i1.p1  ORF type:complete len:353 (+),score=36.73 TRINITY_DN7885_c0_g1_i1:77-1135(+)